MARKMVVLTRDGSTPVLEEVPATNEAELQQRMTANPDLIPIEEFGMAGPLMVVGKETSLASGAIDLVGLSRGGDIVLIEFKTGPQNPDFRHALAQAVDYGADIWGMTVEEFETTVAMRYFNGKHCPDSAATKAAGSLMAAAELTWGDEWSPEAQSEFTSQLTRNLKRGAIHYVVVAQRFTDAMLRTADYLNSVTSSGAFYLVELIRFTGDGLEAFEARTVLRPQPQGVSKSSASQALDRESFLAREADEARRARLDDFFDFCTGMGISIFWGVTGVSLRMRVSGKPDPVSIGWIHPTGVVGWMGLTGTTLGYSETTVVPEESVMRFVEYARTLAALPGAQEVTVSGLAASRFDSAAEAANFTAMQEAIADLVEGS